MEEHNHQPENLGYSSAAEVDGSLVNFLTIEEAQRLQLAKNSQIISERKEKIKKAYQDPLKRRAGETELEHLNRLNDEYQKISQFDAGGAIRDGEKPAAEEGRKREKYDRDLGPKTPADPGSVEYSLMAEKDGLLSLLKP